MPLRNSLFSFDSLRRPTPFSSLERKTQERKRKIYLAALLFGLPSVVMVWLRYKGEFPFIKTSYVILIGMMLVWIGLLLWRRIPLHWVEISVQTTLSIFYLGKYVDFLQLPDSMVARSEINAVFWVMAFSLILGYVLANHTIALLLALGYILVTGILSAVFLLPERYDLFLEVFRNQIRLIAIALIAFALAKAKDDVIEMQSELLRMNTLANTDALTGLPNRRMLSKVLEERSQRRVPLALLLIDIDHFKRINDTHGHDTGDIVLMRVAHTLRLHTREEDMMSRWGGEEFLALIHARQQEEILAIAERMRRQIENLHFGSFSITISIGATAVREHESLEMALKRVDLALYEAKSAGRNSVRWQA